MAPAPLTMLPLFSKALKAELGWKVKPTDAEKFKREFYRQRKEAGDAAQDLALRVCPQDPEILWLVRASTHTKAPATATAPDDLDDLELES